MDVGHCHFLATSLKDGQRRDWEAAPYKRGDPKFRILDKTLHKQEGRF